MSEPQVVNLEVIEAENFSTNVKPVVEVKAAELDRMVRETQAGLIAADAGIFQRDQQLVRVAVLEKPHRMDGVERSAGTPIIVAIERPYLRLLMARSIDFTRYDGRSKKEVPASPPGDVATALLSAVGEWDFPTLRGLSPAPTLRTDGSLIAAAGYDGESGLYLHFDATAFPTIDPHPSRADAAAALETIYDLFAEFEFLDGARGTHAAAAIAALITAAIRPALRTAPAFGVNAFKAGSGKTELVQAISRAATGREAAVMAMT